MKCPSFFKLMILMIFASTLTLTIPAFAGDAAHTGSVVFSNPVQINGNQVPAGDYKVSWDGVGPNVNLRILRGNKEVAAAPATLKQLDTKAREDAAETKTLASGGRELTAIRFAGKNYELDLANTASQAEIKNGDSVK